MRHELSKILIIFIEIYLENAHRESQSVAHVLRWVERQVAVFLVTQTQILAHLWDHASLIQTLRPVAPKIGMGDLNILKSFISNLHFYFSHVQSS